MYILDVTGAFRIDHLPDTYIYHIEPVADEIAVISSDDCLRLINPVSMQGPASNIIPNIHAEVTCLKALDGQNGILCTAGRDGLFSIWDLRGNSKVAELKSGSLDHFAICYSISFLLPPDGNLSSALVKTKMGPPRRILICLLSFHF